MNKTKDETPGSLERRVRRLVMSLTGPLPHELPERGSIWTTPGAFEETEIEVVRSSARWTEYRLHSKTFVKQPCCLMETTKFLLWAKPPNDQR